MGGSYRDGVQKEPGMIRDATSCFSGEVCMIANTGLQAGDCLGAEYRKSAAHVPRMQRFRV